MNHERTIEESMKPVHGTKPSHWNQTQTIQRLESLACRSGVLGSDVLG